MNVRDLKLAVATGVESDEVKSLNKFLDDLFSNVKIYTECDNTDLVFMIGNHCIMKEDLTTKQLWYRRDDFIKCYNNICTSTEIQEIILYKVEEYFNCKTLTPISSSWMMFTLLEEAFNNNLLTQIVK